MKRRANTFTAIGWAAVIAAAVICIGIAYELVLSWVT